MNRLILRRPIWRHLNSTSKSISLRHLRPFLAMVRTRAVIADEGHRLFRAAVAAGIRATQGRGQRNQNASHLSLAAVSRLEESPGLLQDEDANRSPNKTATRFRRRRRECGPRGGHADLVLDRSVRGGGLRLGRTYQVGRGEPGFDADRSGQCARGRALPSRLVAAVPLFVFRQFRRWNWSQTQRPGRLGLSGGRSGCEARRGAGLAFGDHLAEFETQHGRQLRVGGTHLHQFCVMTTVLCPGGRSPARAIRWCESGASRRSAGYRQGFWSRSGGATGDQCVRLNRVHRRNAAVRRPWARIAAVWVPTQHPPRHHHRSGSHIELHAGPPWAGITIQPNCVSAINSRTTGKAWARQIKATAGWG